MTAPHRTHRADGNQAEIVLALRACGWTVAVLSQVGNGMPDLMVGCCGIDVWMEVKQPGEALRMSQTDWHRKWRGSPVFVVTSVDDAVRVVNSEIKRRCWSRGGGT